MYLILSGRIPSARPPTEMPSVLWQTKKQLAIRTRSPSTPREGSPPRDAGETWAWRFPSRPGSERTGHAPCGPRFVPGLAVVAAASAVPGAVAGARGSRAGLGQERTRSVSARAAAAPLPGGFGGLFVGALGVWGALRRGVGGVASDAGLEGRAARPGTARPRGWVPAGGARPRGSPFTFSRARLR